MKRTAVFALTLAVGLPVCAQRGGGHASFGARGAPAAPGYHGGFTPAPAFHYTRGPIAYPSSAPGAPPVAFRSSVPMGRPVFYQNNHGPARGPHHPFIGGYPAFGYYPPAVYVPYGAFYNDSSDDFDSGQQPAPPDSSDAYPEPAPQPDYSNQQPAPDYSYPQEQPPAGYGYPPPQYVYPPTTPQPGYAYPQPAPQPQYVYPQPVPQSEYRSPQPQPAPQIVYAYPSATPGYQVYVPATPQPQYTPSAAESVILIFKDGRPPEQIQNYLATRTTLTVFDGGRRRVIPLDDLDIHATIRASRQIGSDFKLPTVPGTTGCTGICPPADDNP
jgi:hypothetical protein